MKQMDKQLTEKLLTANQVAEILGLKKTTIYNWITTKKLPFPVVHIGNGRLKRVRFKQSDLRAWMDGLTGENT